MQVYRYKFSKSFQEKIEEFSGQHKYDDYKTLKEKFKEWVDENKLNIMEEERKLRNNGYDGNIEDKIFKSSRYYFMKKSNERKEVKKRKKYTSKNNKLLEEIKMHISKTKFTKPSEAYDDFVTKYEELLNNVIKELISTNEYDKKEAQSKLKKIYKNKFYVHQKS
tara:strand:+ start:57 stop:551 length:495 start_codon:yes stop_codon:yes gene_type:complete